MKPITRIRLASLAGVLAVAAPLSAQEVPARPLRIQRAPAQAQKKTQADYVRLRDAKLAEPWLENAKWVVMDFDKAKALSKQSGKPIFAYFTRSYSP